jgi:hypothetical protein
MAFHIRNCVGTRDDRSFAVQWLACALPCRRFAPALADDGARLRADVGRYSFTVRDLHPLLLAGLPAHSETLHRSRHPQQPDSKSIESVRSRLMPRRFSRASAPILPQRVRNMCGPSYSRCGQGRTANHPVVLPMVHPGAPHAGHSRQPSAFNRLRYVPLPASPLNKRSHRVLMAPSVCVTAPQSVQYATGRGKFGQFGCHPSPSPTSR